MLRELKLRGSMTAVARELSYSHSAVSQQLSLLEKEAGTVLLERVGRNVQLTAAAEDLVRNTESILAAVERAESDLASFHGRPHGVVRVAAFATISRGILPTALASLARDYPALDVRLQLADPETAVVRLTSRQVDVVITDAYPGTKEVASGGVHITTLGQDAVRGYLPRPDMDGDLDQVGSIPWVMEPAASASTQWALRVCRERGFEPVVAHESSDLLFHLRLVEMGLAAAFLPDMVLHEAGSTLSPSPWLPMDQHRNIHFLVRDGSQARPPLQAVLTAVKDAFQGADPQARE
nr:LysR family transcriptional regulator [Paenarthrobacter ureafaciens]